MFASKRRSASTRAVSRKVEGIEPRNTQDRKDDVFKPTEVNTSTTAKARKCSLPRGLRPWHARHQDNTVTREALALLSGDESGEYAKQPQKGREAKRVAGSRIV